MLKDLDPKLGTPGQFTKSTSSVYEFYLSGEILDAEEYVDWFDTIRNARATDIVYIYINSGGGDLYTTLQFLRVMGESEAHIITSVEGCCMSAATMIFLSGREYQVTPHSLFMFHNYSAGTFGKGGEMYDQLQFERAWSEKFLGEVYKDFLSAEEIKDMLHNKDIWMTSDQVIERLSKLLAKREKEVENT
jgi:ATP-dependent protease ClpP protease subunit